MVHCYTLYDRGFFSLLTDTSTQPTPIFQEETNSDDDDDDDKT